MKKRLIRATGWTLALALMPALVAAQRIRPGSEPKSEPSGCYASGVRCLFGRAAGCSVFCGNGSPVCIGASCILGFPRAAECFCEGG